MKKILRILNFIIVILGCLSIYFYVNDNDLVDQVVSYYTKEHSIIIANEYGKNVSSTYFKKVSDFNPQNRQDLLNIYYTVLSTDNDTFTFYCPKKYSTCIEDTKGIMSDSALLSHANNFTHPFNSYEKIKTSYTNAGKITISITRLYSDEKIKQINDKVNELYPTLVSNNKSTTENIRSIHDYIINHVSYDNTYEQGNSIYQSNTAYGALFDGYAVCSGYTDLMSIFLYKMGISNYKVSNDKHIWNLVYLDGKWLHLDLTWDDPVLSNGKSTLTHDYFLVSTEKLTLLDKDRNAGAHVFNQEIYLK
jgi:transglutaminase/protease-like cytokinesis protein 3